MLVLATVTSMSLAPPAAAQAPSVYYASPTGSGSACAEADPCSLAEAQARVRAATATMTDDIVVNLLGGTYRLTEPLRFTPEDGDSGSNGHKVVYQAYGYGSASPHTPVVSGGRTITGWTPHDSARNIWKADVGELHTRQLFVDGVRAFRARRHAGIPGTVTRTSTGYLTTDTSPQTWANEAHVEFVYNSGNGKGNWEWAEPRCPVASITGTSSSTTITMAQPCFDRVRGARGGDLGLPTAIENNYRFLDSAGEFYLDRGTPGSHVLYYKPRAGQDLARAEVVAPVLETVVTARGSETTALKDIQLRGLTFADTTWLRPSTSEGFAEASYNMMNSSSGLLQIQGGVELFYSHDLRFERNRFVRMGGAGLTLDTGSKRNEVVGNVVTDVSGNGVQVGNVRSHAPPAPRLASDNLVANNYIHRVGREYPGAYGVWNAIARNTTITHNEITNLPRGGIASNFRYTHGPSDTSGTVVSYNHVHDYMKVMRDGGGFDTNGMHNGRDGLQSNAKLIGNVFHDDHNRFGQIYFDLWASGFEVVNNVAYHSKSLDFNTVPVERWPCCNEHLHNYYDQDNHFKYIPNADIVLDNPKLPPSAMPVSIIRRAGLEPEYRDLLPPRPLPSDQQAPTAPTGLKIGPFGSGPAVTVSWSAASDNVGVTGYEVTSGDTVVAAVTGAATKAGVFGLEPGRSYPLVVRARDAAGNLSPPSNSVTVRVRAPGDPSLIGHWTFDDGGGTAAADSSGSRNTGAVSNGRWVVGRVGGGLAFNGTSTSVSMGKLRIHSMHRESFSVAASFRAQGSGWRRMVTKGHWGDSPGYMLQYNSGRIAFGVGANADTRAGQPRKAALVSTTAAFGDNRWHQVTAVVDRPGRAVRIYVDGVAQPLTKHSGFCGTVDGTVLRLDGCPYLAASSNDPLTVGSHKGQAEFFAGELDDVRIYRGALTADTVRDVVHLAGHWKFDEGTGSTTADWTGNDANEGASPYASIHNAAWIAGKRGNALRFNGVDSHVSMGNAWSVNPGKGSFTVAAWFRSTAAGWQRMVTKGHWGNSYGYLLQYNAGRVAFGVGAGGTASKSTLVHTPKEFGDGQWHHAAAVVDRSGQTIRVYVDGVAQPLLLSSAYCGALADSATLDISGCPAIDGTSWDPLTIGSYNGTREFFDGSVDDVRIYLKPLSGPEVGALVTAGG